MVWHTPAGFLAMLDDAPWVTQFAANYTPSSVYGQLYSLPEAMALLAATATFHVPAPVQACGPDVFCIPGAPSVITPSGRTRPMLGRLAFFHHMYTAFPALHSLVVNGVPWPPVGAHLAPLWLKEPLHSPPDSEFLHSEYAEWISMGALIPCNSDWVAEHGMPMLVTPCFVARGSKPRHINDYQYGNLIAPPSHVQYEAMVDWMVTITYGDFLAKLDVRSAYFHIALAKDAAPYFCVVLDGKVWQATTVPFGFSPSPELDESLMRVARRVIRQHRLVTTNMIDDSGLNGGKLLRFALARFHDLICTLASHGWLVPWDKVQLPSWAIDLLGFHLDTKLMTCSPTQRRVESLQAAFTQLLSVPCVPLLFVAHTAGMLVSMQGMFHHALPLAQPLLDSIRQAYPIYSWRRHVPVTPLMVECVQFIRSHWGCLASMPIHPPTSGSFVLQTDATEYSESIALYSGHLPVADYRPPLRCATRSLPLARIEWHELNAQLWALQHFDLADTIIQPVLDSKVACAYVHAGGGPVASLAALAWQHTRVLVERRLFQLKPIWIPSGQNALVDALSRIPIPGASYYPQQAYPGAFAALHLWLAEYRPSSDWLLWPSPGSSQPLSDWPYVTATPYQAVAHGPAAFLIAPPASWARRVLRWVVRMALPCAVLLPNWYDAVWWPLTHAASGSFTIDSTQTASRSPVAVFMFGILH